MQLVINRLSRRQWMAVLPQGLSSRGSLWRPHHGGNQQKCSSLDPAVGTVFHREGMRFTSDFINPCGDAGSAAVLYSSKYTWQQHHHQHIKKTLAN